MAVRIDWDRLRHVKFANVNTPPESSAGVVRLTSLTALTDSCESRFEGLRQTY
jgi:hypothetical protein